MKKEKSPVAEYMKIRRYMLNFVEQAGEKSVQAPTILELSRKFGVCRPTVSKAMKMLTGDGYIIGRPGLGAFTNPAKINRLQVTKYKNVALIVGDGMLVHFSPYYLNLLGRIGIGAARVNFKISCIQLPSHQSETVTEEIMATPCDALLWVTPPEELLPVIGVLRAKGKRVILLQNDSDRKVGNLYFDYEGFGYRIGKKLLAEGRSKVVYLLNTANWSRPLAGLQRAYREAGIELDSSLFFPDVIQLWPKLEKLLHSPGRVDAVFSAVCPTSVFLPFYRQLPPEIRSGVRFIVEEDGVKPDAFTGWIFETPFQKMADEVCRLLALECAGIPQDRTLVGIALEEKEVKDGVQL